MKTCITTQRKILKGRLVDSPRCRPRSNLSEGRLFATGGFAPGQYNQVAGQNDNDNNNDDDNGNGKKENSNNNDDHHLVTKSAGQTELIAARDPLCLAESLR